MKRIVILLLLAFLVLGVNGCPTEPEEEEGLKIGEPPSLPVVPPPDSSEVIYEAEVDSTGESMEQEDKLGTMIAIAIGVLTLLAFIIPSD